MLLIAALSLSACTDVTEPTVDYGGNTFINDYSALVDAVNNLNKTLKERFDALNTLLRDGMADIKVEINNNTGAITAQGESLKAGLNTINTTIFNGFTAIKTTIDDNGDKIVTALNENGEILRLQIDTTGNLLNATLIANAEAIIKAINDQTSTMKERFNALTTAIETGLKDIKVEINKNTGAIKLLDDNTQGSLGNINTSLLKIDETLLNGFTAIKTTIDDNGDKIVTAMDRNGEVLRFNFVSKVMPSNKARYYKALRDQAEMKEAYEKQLAEKQRVYDGLSESLKACRKDNAELQSLLDDCEKSKKVKSYEVFFTVDKTNITTQERLRLKKFINTLKEQGDYKLTIIGEASSDGVSSKNYKLSEGRLNNVVNFLKKQGIKDFDIKLGKAIGDSNGCSKEECRRVLIIIE